MINLYDLGIKSWQTPRSNTRVVPAMQEKPPSSEQTFASWRRLLFNGNYAAAI
jgi:hypothetical protein